jgi:hypothetical protein
MEQEAVRIALTAEEQRLIWAYRDVPTGQPRELLGQVLTALCELVREPHCAQVQADGVPCTTPTSDCAECLRLKEVLADLRRDLTRS